MNYHQLSKLLIIIVCFVPALLGADFNYDSYSPNSMEKAISQHNYPPEDDIWIDVGLFKYKVRVAYTGEQRQIEPSVKNLIVNWGKSLQIQSEFIALFQHEIKIREGTNEYWLPIQESLLPTVEKELSTGSAVDLYIMLIGATKGSTVFVANEFTVAKNDKPLVVVSSSSIKNQIQLNGFLIHQYRSAVANTLGEPFKTGKNNYSEWEAYRIDEKAYMVFEFLKDRPNWIYSIQITGETKTMEPFVGLVLGDRKDKVTQTLGKPNSIKRVENEKADLFTYESRNFSVEISDFDLLVSIRINGFKELFTEVKRDNTYWEDFRNSVLSKDHKSISQFFRPDAEIYKNNETLTIDKAFNLFFEDLNSKFIKAIFSETNSIYEELKNSKPATEIRAYERGGVGFVHKFYTGKVLEEIVFLPYANDYRIYEVKFKH